MARACAHVVGVAVAGTSLALALAAWDSGPARSHPESVHAATTSSSAGRIRIELMFRTPAGGSFKATGAVTERGSFRAGRRVVGGSVEHTSTLVGKAGTIRVRARRPCARGRGSWQVLWGSGAYTQLSGRGRTTGGPQCAGTTYPVRAVYTGSVRTPEPPPPPPPPAEPGQYGGSTSQRGEVLFEVAADGRSLTNVRILRISTPCAPPTTSVEGAVTVPGPYAIAQDGSFSIRRTATGSSTSVDGRFTTPRSASGTASVSSMFTNSQTGTTHTCSGNVAWNAVTPRPTATPGRYCGSTGHGSEVCLDVAAGGTSVTRVEVGVVVEDCRPEGTFEVTLTFTEARIGANLGFAKSAQSFEGIVSGSGSVSGFFDPGGAASGRVSLFFVTFDHESNRYTCRRASSDWNARRQP